MPQFFCFALVGLVGTVAHFLVLYTLVSAVGFDPVAGSSLGFLAGALVNYWLNYQLTFRSSAQHRDALPKFLTAAAAGWLLNGALMAILLSQVDAHYLLLQVFVSGIVLLWNFFANRLWTFRER